MRKERWAERHLNWTVIFALWAISLLSYLVGLLIDLVLHTVDPYIADGIAEAIVFVVEVIVSLAGLFLVGAWALKEKARSMWNLLWLIIPFGIIIFLCLGNRSELVSKSKSLESAADRLEAQVTEQLQAGVPKQTIVTGLTHEGIGEVAAKEFVDDVDKSLRKWLTFLGDRPPENESK